MTNWMEIREIAAREWGAPGMLYAMLLLAGGDEDDDDDEARVTDLLATHAARK